jgi:hypothetical protein
MANETAELRANPLREHFVGQPIVPHARSQRGPGAGETITHVSRCDLERVVDGVDHAGYSIRGHGAPPTTSVRIE